MTVTSLPAPRGTATRHPNDPMFKRVKAYVLARDRDRVTRQVTCGICGHPGADGVDHRIPLSECEVRGISKYDSNNMLAAHTKVPCAVCMQAAAALGNTQPGRRAGFCNALRGANSVEYARQKIANRTGLVIVGVRPSDGKTRRPPATGERDW